MTTSFADYLQLYEASWLKLQTTSPRLNSYEDRSLYSTWQITLDRIQDKNAASAALLRFWAYFDKQDVWFGLIQPAHSYTDAEAMKTLTEDELSFNAAVRLLCEFGLVSPEPTPGGSNGPAGYGVHSCVHSWTIFVLNQTWDRDLARLALRCVAANSDPSRGDHHWLFQQRILRHAARHAHFIRNDMVNLQGMWLPLQQLGSLHMIHDKESEAELIYSRALEDYQSFGPEHTRYPSPYVKLGPLYMKKGRYEKAEALYLKALRTSEKFDPIESPMILVDLGELYLKQLRLPEAETMLLRALKGYEDGESDTSGSLEILCIRWHLSDVYEQQDKLSQAKAIRNEALQGYGDVSGLISLPYSNRSLIAVIILGALYVDTGRRDAAKRMYLHALAGFTAMHGPASVMVTKLEQDLIELEEWVDDPREDDPGSSDNAATEPSSPLHKRRRIE